MLIYMWKIQFKIIIIQVIKIKNKIIIQIIIRVFQWPINYLIR